ncbi:serine--tRNA ligase [Rickettsiales endosymbiont of Stachyamoeba lipophora]|uniref:serine--tRNA ligase n=1 Tax=Rickettsiales endosymbiont of Stachyamoeba lipophora TaxID=2486578 RepID=UPI000F646E4E|nr:serine--tRNA ligase [Rickettsiales endosymbiont of Stachyamoeba lipophora]AZL15385.1 serine--tRNA ligase [Rickettsiales endosymbiont of Stachyamoeba lipophora]
MLDINFIRNNSEKFDEALKSRNLEPLAHKLIELDNKRRSKITSLQELQQKRNESAKVIGSFQDKKSAEFQSLLQDAAKIKEELAKLEQEQDFEEELYQHLITLPNIPEEVVPIGPDETANQEVRKFGKIPSFNFVPKQHFELGEELHLMDFETASKMSGSRFVVLKRDLANLERALANFMLDLHTQQFGYTEVSTPFLVKDPAMFGVAQLPKFAEDSFVTTDGYRLIPTGEVSLTNMVADKILSEEELPLRLTTYTPCFRSEAGSAGRDTRGMIRLHQFSKVELVSITKPQDSDNEHERMTNCAEEVLKKLDLPYRIMLLSTGDMGFSSQKTYDLEVWLPGQNCYREISSSSNCGDFQARRMKARFKSSDKKENILVHTLNGSALAVGRTVVAILENYQQEDGSIAIPKVLQSYMGGKTKIEQVKK